MIHSFVLFAHFILPHKNTCEETGIEQDSKA